MTPSHRELTAVVENAVLDLSFIRPPPRGSRTACRRLARSDQLAPGSLCSAVADLDGGAVASTWGEVARRTLALI